MSNLYLLKKGDIIRLEKGMDIYAFIPEKFSRCSNAPFSSKLIEVPIHIGEIRQKNLFFDKPKLTEYVKKCIQPAIKGDIVTTEKVSAFIDSLNLNFSPEEFDTSYFEGEYRVCDTMCTNSPGKHYYFPEYARRHLNSLLVFCEKVDNPGIHVRFFQEWNFSSQIPVDLTSSDE